MKELDTPVAEGWKIYDFPKTLIKNKANRKYQINSSEIKPKGLYPVIDQGQDYIAGYSDKADKLFKPDSPVIIFGDHTRCFKYVDFPFIIGADGTKVLCPNPELFHPKFFYFYLLSLNIPSRGYNRHYKLLKEQKILCPSMPEQEIIATILSKIESAIMAKKKIIVTMDELSKTLLHQLMQGKIKVKDLKLI